MAAKARQILRLTGKSGGPVTDLGKLLGQVTPRTIQRWADGTRTPPLFFKWRAIEFCRTHGITPLPFKLSAKEESEARALASEFPVVKLQRE